ncbi:hypothetical protein FHG87_005117 [Trinorchestia longiramus]|nr:hypothetical protein FHG87_005117 [Trinorchestia longiramus]
MKCAADDFLELGDAKDEVFCSEHNYMQHEGNARNSNYANELDGDVQAPVSVYIKDELLDSELENTFIKEEPERCYQQPQVLCTLIGWSL